MYGTCGVGLGLCDFGGAIAQNIFTCFSFRFDVGVFFFCFRDALGFLLTTRAILSIRGI